MVIDIDIVISMDVTHSYLNEADRGSFFRRMTSFLSSTPSPLTAKIAPQSVGSDKMITHSCI